MNRLERLQAILTTLQSKKIVTAESLAKKFEVSLRTIYRDVRSLEEGGIPIGAEAGIGYYIMEGFYLPPIMFTQEEARALLMAGKIVEKMSDTQTSRIYSDALTKIQAVLESSKKEEMDDLSSKIIVLPNKTDVNNPEQVLNQIKDALVKSVQVSFHYTSNSSSVSTERTVDPLGLCYYQHNWHLIAYCHLRKDYRDFRTDRMSRFELKSVRFKPGKYISLTEYTDKLVCDTDMIKTIIRVNSKQARFMTNSKFQMGFLRETTEDDTVIMEFATYSLEYFARWLLMLGDDVEIIQPESLVLKTKEIIKSLYTKHIQI